jgi:hypothetical protein
VVVSSALAGIRLIKSVKAVKNAKIAFLLIFNLDNLSLSSAIVPPPLF